MKQHGVLMVALVAAALFVTVGAYGQAAGPVGPGGGIERFKQADTNKDGKVSFEELKSGRPKITQEAFKKLDKNSDGFLTPNEMPKHPPLAALIQKADADKDGKVTFEELKVVMPRLTQERFKELDKNGDGVLTKDDAPQRPGPQAGGGQRGQGIAGRLDQADANKDGKVTLEEAKTAFPNMTKERFEHMDHNGDGALSKEDRKQPAK
jgi:Ca2+-binding EF-hand superfamily protein